MSQGYEGGVWMRIRFRGWKLKVIVRPGVSCGVVAGQDVAKVVREGGRAENGTRDVVRPEMSDTG